MKTNFNKIIAGYTPLAWASSGGNLKDPSGKSFLLQVDTNWKLKLRPNAVAIMNGYTYSFCFGEADLGLLFGTSPNIHILTNYG